MNGVHDLGGMQNFGPVEHEENEQHVEHLCRDASRKCRHHELTKSRYLEEAAITLLSI